MHKRVDLGDVEMIANAELNENVFVRVEQTQALLHRCKSLVRVLLEPRVVYEVEQ